MYITGHVSGERKESRMSHWNLLGLGAKLTAKLQSNYFCQETKRREKRKNTYFGVSDTLLFTKEFNISKYIKTYIYISTHTIRSWV